MRRCLLSLLSGALLIGSLCPKSRAADDVQKQLKAEYRSKVLTLRQPYSGEQLRFGADGKLIGDATLGAWTVDGRLEVKSVTLASRVLKIKGRRIRLFFDPFSQQFRDLLSVHKRERAASLFKNIRDRQLWKEVTEQQVEIDVELASEFPDYQEISLATNAIFLNPAESPAVALPSFWQSYFARTSSAVGPESDFDERFYRADQDGIVAPSTLLTREPEYSEAARQAGYHGHVKMSLIVDKAGNPQSLQITKPTGLGLDEESVKAVQRWKFRPGQKDAQPVNVQLSVETSFDVY